MSEPITHMDTHSFSAGARCFGVVRPLPKVVHIEARWGAISLFYLDFVFAIVHIHVFTAKKK